MGASQKERKPRVRDPRLSIPTPRRILRPTPTLCASRPSQFQIAENWWRQCNSPTRVTFKSRSLPQFGQFARKRRYRGSGSPKSLRDSRRRSERFDSPRPTCGLRFSGARDRAAVAGASRERAAPPASPARPCARHSGRGDSRARRRPRHWRGSPARSTAAKLAGGGKSARRRAASASTPTSSSIEPHATGTCRRLIAVKLSSPRCWRAAFMAASDARRERLDDPVRVPDLGVHAIAGRDAHELLGGGGDRGLELHQRDRR